MTRSKKKQNLKTQKRLHQTKSAFNLLQKARLVEEARPLAPPETFLLYQMARWLDSQMWDFVVNLGETQGFENDQDVNILSWTTYFILIRVRDALEAKEAGGPRDQEAALSFSQEICLVIDDSVLALNSLSKKGVGQPDRVDQLLKSLTCLKEGVKKKFGLDQ